MTWIQSALLTERVLTYLYWHIPMAHITWIAWGWERGCSFEKLESRRGTVREVAAAFFHEKFPA